jgi:hypothetical protein
MTTHSSATEAQQTSLTNQTSSLTNQTTSLANKTISTALKRRARSLTKDESVDPGSRAIIRYALLTSDPWLPELVRRANAGEPITNIRGLLGKPRHVKTT